MQVLRTWNAEAVTDNSFNGVTVTNVNSGGPCGNAFNTVQITDATASVTFTTADKNTGLYSMAFATGAVAAQANAQWTITGTPTISWRAYVKTPSSFATVPSIFRAQGSATQVVRLAWDASGHLVMRNSPNSVVGTTTATASVSTWYRIECYGTIGASSAFTAAFYVGNSGTPIETVAATAGNFGTNNVDNVGVGQFAAIANIPTWLVDNIAVGDTAIPLGPFGTRPNFNKTGRRVTYVKANGKRRPAIVTGVAADGNPILRVRHIGETYGTSSIGVPPRISTASNVGNAYLTW